jgi:GR25 family glycosyltransferase involved in LPS biosynthesis
MELLKNTLYINLDHREDRKENVENQLKSINVTGERFSAIKTKAGCVGCTMSHIKCLELAIERNYEYVFICEDDIKFTNPKLFLKNLEQFYQTSIPWDVIIVCGNNCPPYLQISNFCIRCKNVQTTTGYIVHNKFFNTLLSNFKSGLTNLLREPENKKQYAIDMYWKHLQKDSYFFMIIPATVTQLESHSDVENRSIKYDHLMLDIDKKELIEQYQKMILNGQIKMGNVINVNPT